MSANCSDVKICYFDKIFHCHNERRQSGPHSGIATETMTVQFNEDLNLIAFKAPTFSPTSLTFLFY